MITMNIFYSTSASECNISWGVCNHAYHTHCINIVKNQVSADGSKIKMYVLWIIETGKSKNTERESE
jgi:hypothetical protein